MEIIFYFVIIVVLLLAVLIKLFKKSNLIAEENDEKLKAQSKTKNKWLYPSNEFGKMEEGTVYDSKTYKTYTSKEGMQQEINIINK